MHNATFCDIVSKKNKNVSLVTVLSYLFVMYDSVCFYFIGRGIINKKTYL